MVRSLALNELVTRGDATRAVSALTTAAVQLVDGSDSTAEGTAALVIFFALERLGRPDDGLLLRALARPESAVAQAALRVWGERQAWPVELEKKFGEIAGRSPHNPGEGAAMPGYSWRLIAQALSRHPQPWGARLLLTMLDRAPEADVELIYALRLAL